MHLCFVRDLQIQIRETMNCTRYSFFQAKVGHEKEFEGALRKLRGKNSDISEEAAEIQVPNLNLKS